MLRIFLLALVVLLASRPADAAPPSCRAASVASGHAAMCALRDDGVASCWDDAEFATPIRQRALGQFTQVSVGYDRSCGIRRDGTVACWFGYDNYDWKVSAPAPEGRFSLLALEPSCGTYSGSLCLGLREDGTLVEWVADDPASVSSPLAGTFVDWQGPCGLRVDGTVECIDGWTAPDGHFRALGKGERESRCGIRDDGTLACWTKEESIATPLHFPAGEYDAIAMSSLDVGCALDAHGAVVCREGETEIPFPAGTYRDITTAPYYPVAPMRICAVSEDGDLVCLGGSNGQSYYASLYQAPVIGSFTHVVGGGDAPRRSFGCALDPAGEISCWGNMGQYAPFPPPAGPFDQISLGTYSMCGRRPDHGVECWSSVHADHSPEGTFQQISVSFFDFACGVHDDGTVDCWRADTGELLDAPGGQFTEVAAAGLFSCGLRPNGDAQCWTHPFAEQVHPVVPPGPFVHLAGAGNQLGGEFEHGTYVCGIRPGGSIECWGNAKQGQLDPPDGTYQSVVAGAEFVCALRTDGEVDCWGEDLFTHAPKGPFVEIAAGYRHTCAMKTNGSFECWGQDQTASFCGSDAACGDGEAAFPEQCDDGDNNDVGQPCTNDCEIVRCGRPVSIRTQKPRTGDALFVLLAATESRSCAAAVCDVDHSSTVTAADALLVLRAAVGLGGELTCT